MMNRKSLLLAAGVVALLALGAYWVTRHTGTPWKGVDENVVEKFARDAGHPPREPYLNTDQGDLLLFVFLVGGAAGGFLLGYYWHDVFGRRPESKDHAPDA